MKDTEQKIIKEIEKNKKEQIRFLQKLVQTPSSNPYIENPQNSDPQNPIELNVAELIFEQLRKFGLSPKLVGVSPQRPNIICEIGSGKRTLIFNGHMDTVLPTKGWKREPFSGKIENGKLFGLGALDMKSALSCFVFMAKSITKFVEKFDGKVMLQFVVDEESMANSDFGTKFLLKEGYLGNAAIIGEPGAKKITIGNRGGFRFRIETFGKAIHTGSREWEEKKKGKNAILEMKKVIDVLKDLKFPQIHHFAFPKRKNVFTFPTVIKGGRGINIVPDYCVAFGDLRILPNLRKNEIEQMIKERLKNLKVKYRFTPLVYVPAVFVNPREKIVMILKEKAEEILKRELKIEGSGPWSDMWMFVKRKIPAINFGPDGKGVHGANEFVYIKSVINLTKIYTLTALKFFSDITQ